MIATRPLIGGVYLHVSTTTSVKLLHVFACINSDSCGNHTLPPHADTEWEVTRTKCSNSLVFRYVSQQIKQSYVVNLHDTTRFKPTWLQHNLWNTIYLKKYLNLNDQWRLLQWLVGGAKQLLHQYVNMFCTNPTSKVIYTQSVHNMAFHTTIALRRVLLTRECHIKY